MPRVIWSYATTRLRDRYHLNKNREWKLHVLMELRVPLPCITGHSVVDSFLDDLSNDDKVDVSFFHVICTFLFPHVLTICYLVLFHIYTIHFIFIQKS